VEYSIINQANAMEIVMAGQFTFNFNQKFKQILTALERQDIDTVRVNLEEVDFIDSSGLGMLLLLRDECQKRDIVVSLHNAQGQVKKILAISKFEQIFAA
jgi:anti-anti-sigma factor